MVKVNAPAMSLDASGSLGGALVFSKWKGRPYVRTLVKPSNPKSALQVSMRASFKFLSQYWATISTVNQATWEDKADQLVASPFNAYMSVNQERWRNFLTPSQADPAAGTGTPGTLGSNAATAGVRQITLAISVATVADNWGCIIYRGDATGFTPSISNVIAIIPAASASTFQYVDTPLDPGTYYYVPQLFSDDGVKASAGGELSATVV